ncbi:hypothetical protein BN424_103 [Carnobacterium maltaromaticum LMA28]|uniref:Uncharacterized protein n=1 Tax=Carnobacterium maltaromaticum LMA28 TaxID=1234679 RepID=K8EM83_CARML|nr:hypothetical protein [Carnobacterium maltaromaticum]CCO09586.2 hypothetical protein BN424_103 [Carnobacterium maltaromaticum LMA28]
MQYEEYHINQIPHYTNYISLNTMWTKSGLKELIDREINKVDKADQRRVEKMNNRLMQLGFDLDISGSLHVFPASFLISSLPALMQPALLCMDYLSLINDYNFSNDGGVRNVELYEINGSLESFMISIKTGLDRITMFHSFFRPEIGRNTTFGRIKIDSVGKETTRSGLLQIAKKKSTDSLMMLAEKNYSEWIKTSVKPRDIFIHYNGVRTVPNYSLDGRTSFKHFSDTIFKTPVNNEEWLDYYTDFYYYKDVIRYRDLFYNYLFDVMEITNEEEFNFSSWHFISNSEAEKYKKFKKKIRMENGQNKS